MGEQKQKVPVVPYRDRSEGKKEQMGEMFDNISARYDLLNRVLSAGIDKGWRKKAINLLAEAKPKHILDIATGTGDLAIEALRLQPEKITGVDISEGMLQEGRKKLKNRGLESKIELLKGDSENLQFPEHTFDAAMVSFGVRNFENLEKGLAEILRVLKPGGTLVVLEFSKPRGFIFKHLYYFYFKYILPFIGRLVSRDISAYSYLPQSVKQFPSGQEFVRIMQQTGYLNVQCKELTLGISSLYWAKKA